MKRQVYTVLLFILVIGSSDMLYAQNDRASRADRNEQRQYERQLKKEANEKERERMIELTRLMVEYQRFVLEANYISNRYGQRVPVSPNLNFIMVDSLEATIQLGSAFTVGYNGVGGETYDGRITEYEYTTIGKNKSSYSIRMTFMSPVGTYDIMLTANPEGYADATIRGNWSGQLNYHGKLIPISLSRIYKGYSRY